MENNSLVKVSIFGNDYRMRGDADADYIQKIAAYVDRTMRDIADDGRHVSSTRIAILAAINIADELHRARHGKGKSGMEAEEKAAELLKMFEGDELEGMSLESSDS